MNLSQIEKNKKAKILKINAQTVLKKRLSSLDITVGKEVKILETSLQKNTIKIAIGLSSVALRLDEAKLIEVEEIA